MESPSDVPPSDRKTSSDHRDERPLTRIEERLQDVLLRPSVRAELAWRRILRTAVLIRRPLQSRNVILFLLAVVLAGGLVVALQGTALPSETIYMVGIFVVAALLWMTEALPLFATALLVVGLEVLLLANPGGWAGLGFEQGPSPDYQVFIAPIADPIIVLFFGGFLLARASVKEGVDQALAGVILRVFGGRPLFVMLGLMIATALFSMWMSNTAATAMMITLVTPMLAQIPKGDPIRKGFVLSIPFAANIGGMGTPISSPPNAVAVGFLSSAGFDITFLEWMLVAVPLAVGMLFVTWLLLWTLFPPRTEALALEPVAHRIDGRGLFALSVIALTIGLWLTDRWHGLPTAVVALVPAVAFTATGLLDQNDVDSLEWNILILIAGGIALGVGIQRTGLDQLFVRAIPAGGPFVLIGMLLATILISTFMSNTAAANLILPVSVSFAVGAAGSLGPVQVAISIALAASMAMSLPVSTPPNAIAYASGEVEARDFARAGALLGLLALVLIGLFGGPIIAFWIGF